MVGFELFVGFDGDVGVEVIEDECLVCFGEVEFLWEVGVLDGVLW